MNLFRNKKSSARRVVQTRNKRKKRAVHLLEVTATAETERRHRNQTILLNICEVLIVAGLLAFALIGIRALVNSQIFENKHYDVRVVEVNTDGVMSRDEAMAKAGIHEGLNIFSLNLESARAALSSIPEVRSARVERILPDTVSIHMEARHPVAWVAPKDMGVDPSAMESSYLIDADGVVMKPQRVEPKYTLLPVVFGVPTEQWRAGDRIELPELRAALDLFVLASQQIEEEILLRAADISKGWCVVAWNDPTTRYTFGLEDIPAQIKRLQLILRHINQTSRKIATINLIPERNTPVTFQGDLPVVSEKVAVPTAKSKGTKKSKP